MDNRSEKKYIVINEIKSQGEKWIQIIKEYYKVEKVLISNIKDNSIICFMGTGSSYNNSLMAEFAYNKLMNKQSYSINSSEYLFNPDVFIKPGYENKKVFAISRTGETTDTLLALKMLKKLNIFLISLTTFPNSNIARNSNLSIVFEDLREESITSNRVVSSIALFLLCLFYKLCGKESLIEKINDYTETFFSNYNQYCNYISSIVKTMDFNKFVFLGPGPFYSIAREAALKVREMSITNTEFWPTLEFRQGYSTNIEEDNLIIAYLSKTNIDFQVKACMELEKAGAKILVISDKTKLESYKKFYDYILEANLGLQDELLCQVYYQLFGQLIGYYQALKKNIDPSNPKNLDYIVKI
ncbi:MAG: SIS domain-containing protein [Actinobacteria bacterium]|nr:SIS domain-containing protein [Actinomycetota bacterium]MCL5772324.1 SIS domain-containing protein [Actinomycetota bacterium]